MRADEGRIIWWVAQRAVVPVGAEARCDYHMAYAYAGFPPEAPSPEQVSADLKKAGIGVSHAELVSQPGLGGDLVKWEEGFRTHGGLFRSQTVTKPIHFAMVEGNLVPPL